MGEGGALEGLVEEQFVVLVEVGLLLSDLFVLLLQKNDLLSHLDEHVSEIVDVLLFCFVDVFVIVVFQDKCD